MKNINIYSFNEECYVYLGDYIKLLQEEIDIFDTLMKDSNVNEYTKMLIKLLQENKQLKEQLLVAQTNEETFRLEMEDITKILGLDENTLFDDVKLCVKSLKEVSE